MSNLIEAADLVHQDLKTAIIRDPITVLPETTVREAIALMSGARSHCEADATAPSASQPMQTEARASCVVVVASQKVVGLLTERDVVRLCAQQHRLDEIPVSQVMTAAVLSLRESDLTDLFAAINFLQQNHIRHLPVVDERDCLTGLVTHETLRQVLQPTDLLRLRRVQEVMTPTVVTADPTDSLLAIAQRMASHHISSVVVVQRDRPEDLIIPIGIVTERDLVQFQALELDFERYSVAQVMSYPVIAVPETETLVTVQQLIERYLIRRVVVTGEAGELLGIVTQTNLLKALSPLELYRLTEVLEARVKQLETEKVNLLEHRNLELEEQVASRTQKLLVQLQREQVVAHLATQIRSSLSLQTILDTTVEQIHQVMGCDRVNIWKFAPDLAAVVVAESTGSPRSLLGKRVWDECYQQRLTEVYREGHVRVVPDIYTTAMTDCHREFLIHLQTRAKVLLPLFCGEQLWGLLNVSESQTPRAWQADEIDLLQTLANQLTSAIQQASTHAQLQAELQERQQAETLLQIKNDLLARVAAQEPLTDTLNRACIAVEELLEGAVCSILLRDSQNQLRDGAAPNLPPPYRRQADGIPVGEGVGSCGTAAYRRAKVVVADIAHDPLWQDIKELPLAFDLRACWSTPIMTVDGVVLGTFAVYYREVRLPDAAAMAVVDSLVHIVMLAIQQHRNEIALKQTNQRLQEAQRIAHLGHWEQDLQQNTLYWSEEVFRLFELDPQHFRPTFEAFWEFLHPADRESFQEAYGQHLRDRQRYEITHRLQMPDGRIKYVKAQCESTFSPDGTPLISRGTVQDITGQQESEIRRERAEASVRQVIEGTAAFTGEEFFPALVRHIAEALGVRYVSVSRATTEGFQVLAFFADGELCPPPFFPYELVPCCQQSLQTGSCCLPTGVQAVYPDNPLFIDFHIESYLGVRLVNAAGEPTGNLCILDDRPLADPDWAQTLVSIFAARAGAELERLLTAQALAQLNAELEERVAQRTNELAEREARLQDFLDNANDLIQIVDIDTTRFRFVNQAWRKALGYTAADVAQLTCFDVLAPECRPRCETVVAQMRSGCLTALEDLELVFVSKSGQRVVVEGNVNCRVGTEADGHQRPVSTRGIFRDVTAKKAAEQELQQREARYRGLLEAAADAILLANAQGYLLEGNPQAEKLLGYNREELLQLHFTQLHPPQELEIVQRGFAGETIETLIVCKDGTPKPVEITSSTFIVDGQTMVQGIFRDISERKAIERALRAENAFRRLIMESLAEGLCVCHEVPDYPFVQFTVWNPQMELITGYTQAAINEMGWYQTLYPDPEMQARAIARMAAMRKGDHIQAEEWTIRHRDGSDRILSIVTTLLPTSEGQTSILAVMQDVTERRQAEQERHRLLQELAGFKLGLEQATIVAITDLDGVITYVSQKFVDISGYSKAELIGQTHRLVNSGTHPPSFFQDLWQTIRRGEVWRGEICNRAKNGRLYWVDSTIVPFSNAQGEPEQYLSIRLDITSQKQSQMLLQESQQFLQTVLDTVPMRVFWKDRASRYLGANARFLADAALLSEADIIGKTDFDMPWAETEAAAYRADDRSVMDTSEAKLGILETQHQQDGQTIWLETNKLPLHNLAGEVIGVLGTYQDVTARRNAEIALRRQLAAIEAAIDGIAILQNERFLYLNSSHVELFGYQSNQELIGQSWRVLYSPEELERFDQEIWPALYERMFWQGEVTALRKEGTTFPQQLSLTLSADNLLICVSQDISDRKAAEAELHRTNAELARATRLKDEFLANMSHELRTPLNAILGMTEGLQEEVFGSLNPRQVNALQTVERSANHLLSLINDILDVAKIESGQIHLDYSHVAIEQLCSSSLAFIKQQALKKRIQLRTQIPPLLPDLWVDEIRIRQVLLNLLTNAVKFTPDGGTITLAVTVPQEQGASEPASLRIAITDTGIGIAPENIAKLFKPFVQIDSALNRKQTGTGLGLALVKQIVELHGGQVGLTSELGVGSCFTVDLPYAPQVRLDPPPTLAAIASEPASAAPHALVLTTPQPPLVLLAEDNPANVATTSSYLAARGYRLLCACNGQEAIDLALFHHPDVILMDIQMPGVDGLEAIQKIRQHASLRQTPIIALTAFAMQGDRDRCLAAGADTYFSKPVRLKQLDSAIKELLRERRPE